MNQAPKSIDEKIDDLAEWLRFEFRDRFKPNDGHETTNQAIESIRNEIEEVKSMTEYVQRQIEEMRNEWDGIFRRQ